MLNFLIQIKQSWQTVNSILYKGKFTIPSLLNGPDMLPSASNQVGYLDLICLLSVRGGCGWLWMRSQCKSIQLMLEFLKGPFLVQCFFYWTLMTFLVMLSVTLISMLMILHWSGILFVATTKVGLLT